jgi:hypothetical protein
MKASQAINKFGDAPDKGRICLANRPGGFKGQPRYSDILWRLATLSVQVGRIFWHYVGLHCLSVFGSLFWLRASSGHWAPLNGGPETKTLSCRIGVGPVLLRV